MRMRFFGGLAATLLLAAGSAAFAQSAYQFNSASASVPAGYPLTSERDAVGYTARYRAPTPDYHGPVASQPTPAAIPLAPNYGGFDGAPVSPYQQALDGPHGSGAVAGPLHDGGDCLHGLPCLGPAPRWFFSGGALLMRRAGDDRLFMAYDTADPTTPVIESRDVGMGWTGGFETRFGRYLGCGQKAVEAVYWGLFPGDRERTVYADDMTGALSHAYSYHALTYDGGTFGDEPIDNWYGDAQMLRLRRSYEVHNVEVNFLANPWGPLWGGCALQGCGAPRMQVAWLAGFRWFRFGEGFAFSADGLDTVWDGDPNELCHHINVRNDLLGFQLGANMEYCLSQRLSFFTNVRGGVFHNHMRYSTMIGGANGAAWVNAPGGPDDGFVYDIATTKNDVAFLAELQLGGRYQISRCLSANFGYRVVSLAGIAAATQQWPQGWQDFYDAHQVNSSGSLLLHGFQAGLELNY